MRSAATLPSRRSRRQPVGWVLLLVLVGCLNPQPDPFPQNHDDSPEGTPVPSQGPNDVRFAPRAPGADDAAGSAPAPAQNTPSGTASEQPPAPTAATPPIEGGAPPDAGEAPDAGVAVDAGVPANAL